MEKIDGRLYYAFLTALHVISYPLWAFQYQLVAVIINMLVIGACVLGTLGGVRIK